MTSFLLVGAGGHARAITEALAAAGHAVVAYADPRAAPWLDARHLAGDAEAHALAPAVAVAIGIGGADPAALRRRLELIERLLATGRGAPPVVHYAAWVSRSARLGEAVTVLAGAVVQPATTVGRGAIVNSRAVVEYDSAIGAGSHVGPGAIVLGGCTVGACAMIGAGAVVLQGSTVPDETLVPALARFPK